MTMRISSQPAPLSRTAERDRHAVPRRVAFWLMASVLTATMLGTTLPTPLYVIYQARCHFSAAIVTVTFAVYAASVMATLLLAGRSSDQAGRKPVLAVALGASALSAVVFILAPDVGALIAARIVSGLSAGLITGTATAALTEMVPASGSRRASLAATAANMGGLGLGPLIAGLGVPERGRDEFIAAGVAGFAAFALLGLFAALAPTFLGGVLHEDSHAVQGGVVFLLLAVGTVTQLALARFDSRRVVLAGLGLFLAALALIVPVVGVGIASGFIGDFAAVLAFSILIAALCLLALASIARPRAQRRPVVSQ
jgi:MFS family permease